jgi:hypothetical protein
MARLVAQYADEFNLTGGSLDRIGPAYGRVVPLARTPAAMPAP